MDPMLILPLILLAVMLVFMWRSNKKRQAQASEMKSKAVVGAEVMTQAGIFGTIVDIDEPNNVTTIETTPGTQVRVHSATVLNVVTPTVPDDASALMAEEHEAVRENDAEIEADTPLADEPVDIEKHDDAPVVAFDDTTHADNIEADRADDATAADDETSSTSNPLGKYTDPDAKA